MTERLRIECECGYENLVPRDRIGETISCAVCEADLEVREPEATTPTPEQETSAPPGNGGETESPSPAQPYRSPFEADEDEASEFFDVVDEESRGPFTLEAQEGSRGISFAELEEAERPRDFKSGHVYIPTESPSDRETGEMCSECGRKIRGDWDRYPVAGGVLCYVCSNQAGEGTPLRLQRESESGPRELSERDLLIHPDEPEEPEPEKPWYFDPESETFGKVVAGLAFLTIAFAGFVWMTGWGTPSDEAAQQVREETAAALETQDVPYFVTVLAWLWRGFAGFAGVGAALFATKGIRGSLPYDDVFRNVAYLTLVTVLLTCIAVTALLIVSLVGPLAYIIVIPVGVFLQLLLLMNMLDFGIGDILLFFLIFLPLAQFFLQGLGYLIFGAMTAMIT